MADEEKKPAAADAQIQEKLLKTRSVLLSGEIDKESADTIIKQLLVLDGESSEPIKLFINSPGGDVDAGYAIYDMVRFIKAPVTMIGMGLVASAAVLVLLAVPSERRIGLPNSTYLIHQPMSGMRGWPRPLRSTPSIWRSCEPSLTCSSPPRQARALRRSSSTRSVTTGSPPTRHRRTAWSARSSAHVMICNV